MPPAEGGLTALAPTPDERVRRTCSETDSQAEAATGILFFVPTADFLDDPPPLRAPGDVSGGSLGIGDLKGESG